MAAKCQMILPAVGYNGYITHEILEFFKIKLKQSKPFVLFPVVTFELNKLCFYFGTNWKFLSFSYWFTTFFKLFFWCQCFAKLPEKKNQRNLVKIFEN